MQLVLIKFRHIQEFSFFSTYPTNTLYTWIFGKIKFGTIGKKSPIKITSYKKDKRYNFRRNIDICVGKVNKFCIGALKSALILVEINKCMGFYK